MLNSRVEKTRVMVKVAATESSMQHISVTAVNVFFVPIPPDYDLGITR